MSFSREIMADYLGASPKSFMEHPTGEMRWLTRTEFRDDPEHGEIGVRVRVLQQLWISRECGTGIHTNDWRDVPEFSE